MPYKVLHEKETFSQKSFSGLATTRVNWKPTDNAVLLECVFCACQEKDLSKMSKKQKQSHKLHAAGEYHTHHLEKS